MFPLHEIPTFIKSKKHGKRYDIDLSIKLAIRRDHYNDKLTQKKLIKKYKLPKAVIQRLLKGQS